MAEGLAARINTLLEGIGAPGDGSLLDRALSSTGREPPSATELAFLRVQILLAAWEEMHREADAKRQVKPESRRVQVMAVLDLLLDVAYHDGTRRDLAVTAEAYELAGYHDGAIMISHASPGEVSRRVFEARRGLPKRLLRHDAEGLFYAVGVLIDEGLVGYRSASARLNERWRLRGGHDRA